MKYEFLENVAIADIAFRAHGKTVEELFENSGLALTETMADLQKISLKVQREIIMEGKNEQELLYNFLEELVYIKDVDGILFKNFKVKISQNKMQAQCGGDTLEKIGRQNLRNDVKAITMHIFEIKKENGQFSATVVVDI